jgi:hypothetical protein
MFLELAAASKIMNIAGVSLPVSLARIALVS